MARILDGIPLGMKAEWRVRVIVSEHELPKH
jgi:hypothetical protein